MDTIAYVVGARPNFVKMAPVERALRRRLPAWRHVRIDTGQHYDREMSGIFEAELGTGPPVRKRRVDRPAHDPSCPHRTAPAAISATLSGRPASKNCYTQ